MWCNNCNRVFDSSEDSKCPVCKIGELNPTITVNCPLCGLEMQPGYISVLLKMDWRAKWLKAGKPDITIKESPVNGGWLRRLAYHCSNCNSFFLYKTVASTEPFKDNKNKVHIEPLCPQCGMEALPDVNFCPFCGYELRKMNVKKISRYRLGV